MTTAVVPSWAKMRTEETRRVEEVLRSAGFRQVDAYRYNSASIRVRVVDPQFEGLPVEKRDALIEPHLISLPERTQADIMALFSFSPGELEESSPRVRTLLMNAEFDDPSPSRL